MTKNETHRARTAHTRPAGAAIGCSATGTGPVPSRVLGMPA
jgi:hypothetical protein